MAGILTNLATLAAYRIRTAAVRAKMNYEALQSYGTQIITPSGAIAPRVNVQAQGLVEREDVNLATCVRIMSDALAWLPLEVKYQDSDSRGNKVMLTDQDHPFNTFWRRPNPQYTTSEVKKHCVASLLTTGNAFLVIKDDDNVRRRRRTAAANIENAVVVPKPSWKMFVKTDKDRETISAYTERKDLATEVLWEPEKVVHLRLYNINDPVYGRSGVEPLRRALWTEYQAQMMQLAHFTADGTPRAIFSPKEPLDVTQQQQVEEFYAARTNPQDRNRLQIAPVPGEFKAVQPTMVEMEFQDMRRFHREQTYALLGIPPGIGGVWEHAHYANAAVQEASFWRHTMIPLANLVADFWTRQLLWRFESDERYSLAFDLSDVEALRSDMLKQARTAVMVSGGPVLTPNEARTRFYDAEPIEDGDTLRTAAQRTGAGDQNNGSAQADGQDGGDRQDGQDGSKMIRHLQGLGLLVPNRISRTARKVLVTTRNAAGEQVATTEVDDAVFVKARAAIDNRIQKNEERLAKPMRSYFAGLKERVLEALETITIEGAYMNGLWAVVGKGGKLDPNGLDGFLDVAAEKAMLRQLFEPIVIELMADFGAEETAQAIAAGGVGIEFDVHNPKIQLAVTGRLNKIAGTTDTTFRDIRRVLYRGYMAGMDIQAVARELTAKFQEYRISRSLLIARTEMTGISNTASRIAWQENGATHKTWIATLDDLTRDYHVMYNGERVPIDSYFTAGPEPMYEPGDSNAQLAENVCNCRCTMVYDYDLPTLADLAGE